MAAPHLSLPAGPRLPPVLQTLRWLLRRIAFLEACRREFGDLFIVRFLGFERSMVMLSDPEAIRILYTAPEHTLRLGAGSRCDGCVAALAEAAPRWIALGDPERGADMKGNNTLRCVLAIATVGSALLAPTASAAPIEQMVPSTVNGEPTGQPAPVRVVQVGADDRFDWGDAGIGAGGLLALAAIASGAMIVARHRPDARHTVA